MKQTLKTLGFNHIIDTLKEYANTPQAKKKFSTLKPYLEEIKLRKHLRETSQARELLEMLGTPPLPLMEKIEEYLEKAVRGELIQPEELEYIGVFLVAVKRLREYLEKGCYSGNGLAFYCSNLDDLEELAGEIDHTIRNGKIDDYATSLLRDLRRQKGILEEKMRIKAENILRNNKSYTSDSFTVNRNGRLCIPVKAAYKKKVPGVVIDQSSTGATLFIEPKEVLKIRDEYDRILIQECNEETRILYTLLDDVASAEEMIRENIRVIAKLDFIFAKGKMSLDMNAVNPDINVLGYIRLKSARHPELLKEECVPLDFQIGGKHRGIIITGPNTGGKTVAIKTVGLMCLMACSGLHVPCEKAEITMNNQILCDIGDGQNISDNLSTFSSHIRNVLDILKNTSEESLVILDELGSGTDPTEGMGLAIAILEQLRLSKCLFLATTHYPDVKEYAEKHLELLNARMEFDRESLKPLYRLELGKSGESCAIYIAKRLGLPNEMLRLAVLSAYGSSEQQVVAELDLMENDGGLMKEKNPKIKKYVPAHEEKQRIDFHTGDSVSVSPEGKIGIVVKPADREGNVLVQIQKEKRSVSHKRLKLMVAAADLYPEGYDFSIIFESVEVRKKRHEQERKYTDSIINYENEKK